LKGRFLWAGNGFIGREQDTATILVAVEGHINLSSLAVLSRRLVFLLKLTSSIYHTMNNVKTFLKELFGKVNFCSLDIITYF